MKDAWWKEILQLPKNHLFKFIDFYNSHLQPLAKTLREVEFFRWCLFCIRSNNPLNKLQISNQKLNLIYNKNNK